MAIGCRHRLQPPEKACPTWTKIARLRPRWAIFGLLHGLNNQLGVIIAHAELLETKADDEAQRARATEVVSAALSAMTISRALRQYV